MRDRDPVEVYANNLVPMVVEQTSRGERVDQLLLDPAQPQEDDQGGGLGVVLGDRLAARVLGDAESRAVHQPQVVDHAQPRRRLLLVERLLQQFDSVIEAKFLGPCAQSAVARNLVVLDRLRGGQHTGVESRRALEFLDDLLTLFEDALDGGALLAGRLLVDHGEHLLQPFNLPFGFTVMFFKGGAQVVAFGRLGHFGQCCENFLFRVVDVFQHVLEKVVEFLRFLGHWKSP